MSAEVTAVVADECENFLGWRVASAPGGIRCRIWVLHSYDVDAEVDPAALAVPQSDPEFEGTLATADEAVEFLAGDDVYLRNRAQDVVDELRTAT